MYGVRPRAAAPAGLQHKVLQHGLLQHAADIVTRISQASPDAEPDEQAIEQLRSAVYGLKSSAQSATLSSSDVGSIWTISTKLWNYCVDSHNTRLNNKQHRADEESIAWLRRFAWCASQSEVLTRVPRMQRIESFATTTTTFAT
jgi:hypothetical protein